MDIESGWTAVGPIGEKDVRRASTRLCNKAWSFNGGAQSGRLSGLEDHVSNGVVTTDTVANAPAAHLVVTEGVSNTATLGAGKLVVVQWDDNDLVECCSTTFTHFSVSPLPSDD